MSANWKKALAALLSGLIFGLGLAVSGLSNPDNVLQFLTLSPDWSPALLFVMGAGILVSFAGYKWVLRRGPVLEDKLQLPSNNKLDRRLLTGAAIFGVGWGLAGFCPGPAIVGLSTGMIEPFIFVTALIIGSQIQRLVSTS
jgi:uncharacterized membrane protein YedE/YeeE